MSDLMPPCCEDTSAALEAHAERLATALGILVQHIEWSDCECHKVPVMCQGCMALKEAREALKEEL